MKIATVFKNGPSTQAVRIPKEFRLATNQVWMEKVGDTLIIKPKPDSWNDFFSDPTVVSDDFSTERNQSPPQNRDDFT